MDFAFLEKAGFEAVREALRDARYKMKFDMRPIPEEIFQRFENPGETIDIADIRYPTWNSWSMKGLALSGCVLENHGNLELLHPDIHTAAVFKMYPCRPSDLDDLRDIIRKGRPSWDRVKRIAQEQDRFAAENETYSGALVIAKRRARAFASISALAKVGIPEAEDLLPWVRDRWTALGVGKAAPAELLDLIRDEDMSWEKGLSEQEGRIAEALGISVSE
ncbi:MAG: hypothetical protein HY556_07050 [Euryarchaeota archaeon]|nr:hypothetical protein [Euryarchaeota archaeon]